MNTKQVVEISQGTNMANGQLWSAHQATWTLFYHRSSFGLPNSLPQESYAILLGTLQTSLYSWCPLITPDTANVHTILASHMMIK